MYEFVSCESVLSPKEEYLGLLQPYVSFGCNPCWILEPGAMRTPLPGTGSLSGEHSMGLGPLTPQGRTCEAEIFLPFLNCHTVGMEPVCSVSLPLLPPSSCLLYILSYRTSVQL